MLVCSFVRVCVPYVARRNVHALAVVVVVVVVVGGGSGGVGGGSDADDADDMDDDDEMMMMMMMMMMVVVVMIMMIMMVMMMAMMMMMVVVLAIVVALCIHARRFMDNATIGHCTNRSGEDSPVWDGQLFAKLVLPFTDMTIKGWAWYQGR